MRIISLLIQQINNRISCSFEIENLSFIKLKSVLACDTLNLLVDSLLEEGGSMPDAIKFTDNSCGFPPLPERNFDEPIRL